MLTITPISHYLIFAIAMFVIGFAGLIMQRKNFIGVLMCLELMLLAVNTNFIAFSRYWNNVDGQIFVFFILTVAAAEAVIGLALVIIMHRSSNSIQVLDSVNLKG